MAGARTGSLHFRLLLPLAICLGIFALFLLLEALPFTSGLLQVMEWRLYDMRIRGTPRSARHYPDPNIVIIGFDERSYREIKEPTFLWVPRFTRLFRMLQQGGAKAVGFDYLQMNTPDEFVLQGIDRFTDRVEGTAQEKEQLAERIRSYAPRLDNELGMTISATGTVIATMIEGQSNRYRGSHPEIEMFAGGENLASINIVSEIEGVVRSMASRWTDGAGRTFPSLSFLLAARYLKGERNACDPQFLATIPMEENQAMLINYVGPRGTFDCKSFYDVDSRAEAGDTGYFRKAFQGKLVLLGPTDVASQDLKLTPFNGYMREYPGVEVQASAINTIIHRDYIRRLPGTWRHAGLILLITLYFLIGYKLSFGRSLAVGIAAGALYWVCALYLFHQKNIWVDMAIPVASLPVVLFASYAYRVFVIEKDRKWLKAAFSRYVSKTVADEILKNPDMVKLGGDGREISVLFSDINHFTTLTETHHPQEIMAALNEYFTLMEEVIFAHGGTLKQFVGDEIMVIFGAPALQEDHRVRAVLTALDMQERLAQWQQERKACGAFAFEIKVGIHCGRAVVGNVGSPFRTEYAAVGDMVNTAARIMALNKNLGTSMLMSEEIYKAAEALVLAEDRGSHRVRGKDQEVHIYSLIGRREAVTSRSSP